ncbi:MAG: bifunctional glutamate N-acetyltransferase/amino-acid acetyltransferase ArgJ [Deltaproteobacteria bacterium]|nr:bifunctional glutamate N-acetyltransferase/amino-acid acetyltransferase ArgJ [Deltaproteobacteria bacterium]
MPPKKKRPSAEFAVPGFKAAGIACGIKKNGKKDLALILSDGPASVAGLFTTNSVKAAPVLLDMKRVRKGVSRGVIINSGNANACTGKPGYEAAAAMATLAERASGAKKGSIMVASTGVIGVPFPIKKVEAGISSLVGSLSYSGMKSAAEAIMTTDAFMKKASAKVNINGRKVTIAGIAKGAGMICPDMATMLAFFATDAEIKAPALRKALKLAADASFNSIIVDNDTSTNDTVMAFANGCSGCGEIRPGTKEFAAFERALRSVSLDLAHMIVRDGEGATRFIEIDLKGAASVASARKAARTIAESFLVKTAFFGGDPNWGRILAALGRSGVRMREEKVDISLNGVQVVKKGLDTGREREAAKAMKEKEVSVSVALNIGRHSAKLWTSDLSFEYVRINSAYRT